MQSLRKRIIMGVNDGIAKIPHNIETVDREYLVALAHRSIYCVTRERYDEAVRMLEEANNILTQYKLGEYFADPLTVLKV